MEGRYAVSWWCWSRIGDVADHPVNQLKRPTIPRSKWGGISSIQKINWGIDEEISVESSYSPRIRDVALKKTNPI
jgi:hypothetical protein